MVAERRAEPRELLAVPLRLANGSFAVTRDISASGMYFEIRSSPPLGGVVLLEMEHAHMRVAVIGEIVRIEHLTGRTGIAVKFRSLQLQP